jgi:hypothetical protein
MARITVNTTGTQPILLVSANIANVNANSLSVTCLQDITVTNSTGIYSYTDFCSGDMNKITTPADNEVSTNMVLDGLVYFGNASATANTAPFYGVAGLSENKVNISWKLFLNGNANGSFYYTGTGYVSSLAPTVAPENPVWISPMSIAVDGEITSGVV